jgi:hypothetical protein
MLLVVGLLTCELIVCPPVAFAQRSKTGLSPQDQQKYDELIKSAKRNEMIGYIAAGLGIALVIAAIPLSYYLSARKKAHQKALEAEDGYPEAPPANRSSPPRE